MARPDAMRCPVCRLSLRRVVTRNAEFRRCGRCRGIWLDAKVLTGMVARRNPGRTGPLRLRRATLPARHRDGRERVCPRCPDLFIKPRLAGRLLLDRCPECGGIWFDGGELGDLLRSRPGATKRRARSRRRSIARRLRREIAEEARQRKAEDFDLVTICDVLVQLVGRLFSRR